MPCAPAALDPSHRIGLRQGQMVIVTYIVALEIGALNGLKPIE
jgi:hypothetical protein